MERFSNLWYVLSVSTDSTGIVERNEKREGFPGQRIVVLPPSVVDHAARHPLISALTPTDVGYFPRATRHMRRRAVGVDQTIFIYCAKGAGWCELESGEHKVKEGDLLVIPAYVPHTYGADEAHPWSIYWFHAKGSTIDPFLRELDVTIGQPVIGLGDDTQLLALFEEALGVLEQGYTTIQLVYASQALAHLIATMILDHRQVPQENANVHQRISQTINFMIQHLSRSLQLDALAAMANLSRSRYMHLFKQQTGYAPIDYFIRLKMHRACQLLDTTDSTVKVIAGQLGYEDPLYFSRVFRSVMEMTPTDYRESHKG